MLSSDLHQSRIYGKSGGTEWVEDFGTSDEDYLRSIITSVRFTLESKKDWTYPRASMTKYSLSQSETKTFSLVAKYRDIDFYFEECPLDTSIKDMIQTVLRKYHEKHGDQLWLNQSLGLYTLKIFKASEYIFPEQYNQEFYTFTYIRNKALRRERVQIVIMEKAQLYMEMIDRSVRIHPEQSIFGAPKPIASSLNQSLSSKSVASKSTPSKSVSSKNVSLESVVSGFEREQQETLSFSFRSEIPFGFGQWIVSIYNKKGKSIEECILEETKDAPGTTSKSLFKDVQGTFRTIVFKSSIEDLPRESYICIRYRKYTEGFFQSVWDIFTNGGEIKEYTLRFPVFNFRGECVHYPFRVYWEKDNKESSLVVNYQGGANSVYYKPMGESVQRFNEEDWAKILDGSAKKSLIWAYRYYFATKAPGKLSVVLDVVDNEKEMGYILEQYPPLSPFEGLKLLSLYPDRYFIRSYAVECLKGLSDQELEMCLPQLVQCLKLETYRSSPLCIFLLTKSLENLRIGHRFYWILMSEIKATSSEYSRELLVVLRRCYLETLRSKYRDELLFVEKYLDQLIWIGEMAKTDSDTQRVQSCLRELMPIPKRGLRLPTSYKKVVHSLLVEECFVLRSKTKPLWLSFETKDKHKVYLILKIGDDVRIDSLALQMMELMDMFWKKHQLNLRMKPYIVLPLRSKVGLIQVSAKAKTLSEINWDYGGSTLASAFSTTSLKAYLHTSSTVQNRKNIYRNFALSCSGYCVFTYIFGVGDRHSDNILCTESGNLFHIDFGYFLGEKCTFLGFQRESNFVVLTPNYIKAMDKCFNLFLDSACDAYAIAHQQKQTFEIFIRLMNHGKILDPSQMNYLDTSLPSEFGSRKAKDHFHQILIKSIQDRRSLLNDFAHLIATREISFSGS